MQMATATTQKQRLELSIEFDAAAGKRTPAKVDLDFDSLLGTQGKEPFVDPHTIVVKRKLRGKTRSYPVQFSDTLNLGNQGWVAWLVDQPHAGGDWWMEFRLRAPDGAMADAPYRPMVGIGDEIYWNHGKWQPVDSLGYHPFVMPADWTGNGLVDLLISSHHTNTYRMPWQGLYYWRNIGSNRRPRFAAPVRLHAKGKDGTPDFFDSFYTWYDVFDWFGSGRPDVISVSREDGIQVYRNTGARDRAGLPRLEYAMTIERPACLAPAMYTVVRVVDWDGSGRPSMLLGALYDDKENFVHKEQIVLMRNRGGARGKWRFDAVPLPVEYKSQPSRMIRPNGFWTSTQGDAQMYQDWRTYSNFEGHRAFSFDVFDIDGDGKQELLCCHVHHTPGPVIEVWRNIGTIDDPLMCYEGILPWSGSYTTFTLRFVRNAAFNGCLLAPFHSGAGIHYFKRRKQAYADPDAYTDTGPLPGQGGKLKVEGYCRPFPVRLGPDAGPSLVCGDEPGFITLTRNVGTRDRAAFTLPERMTDADGTVLRLNREAIVPDNDGERLTGQVKPCVCDWDRDGVPDLVVGGNTRHIFWLEKVDLAATRYERMHRLTVKDVFHPFASRKGPWAGDLFGTGRPVLVAVDADLRVAVFRQGRGRKALTELQPGVPLMYEDGEPVTAPSIGPEEFTAPNICIAVCDWRETGINDLIISSNHQTFLLENTGSNRKPVYKRPVPFAEPDGTVVDTSHHESHVAVCDWDGDGRPDLMIGGEAGTVYLFHRDWLNGLQPKVEWGKVTQWSPR